MIDTTHLYKESHRRQWLAYRWYESGHTCKFGRSQKNAMYSTSNDLIACDCHVRYSRVERLWLKVLLYIPRKFITLVLSVFN